MGTELGILGLYGLLVIVVIVVQALTAASQLGLPYLVTARDEGRRTTGIASRFERILDNSVVAMALFAPAVLILSALGVSTGGTLLAAQAFLVARARYGVAYAAGVPWLRTAVWAVGAFATLYLYLAPMFVAAPAVAG